MEVESHRTVNPHTRHSESSLYPRASAMLVIDFDHSKTCIKVGVCIAAGLPTEPFAVTDSFDRTNDLSIRSGCGFRGARRSSGLGLGFIGELRVS